MKSVLNNKGVTLVELMIVIALSFVLVSVAALSLALVSNADTSKACKAMKSVMDNARVQSMAKGDIKGQLSIASGNGTLKAGVGPTAYDVISKRAITVKYYRGNATSESLAEFTAAPISSIKYNTAGMVTSINGSAIFPGEIVEIAFQRGKRVEAVILYTVTGKTDTTMWYEP